MTTKNNLSIRLTESAVLLRNNDPTGYRMTGSVPSSLLRGLLILELAKPTRIYSIELELQGKVSTSWPEGVGSRRIEVREEHTVFNTSTVFFHAANIPISRRYSSVGPGLELYRDEDEGFRGRPRTPRNEGRLQDNITTNTDPGTRIHSSRDRTVSVDSSILQRDVVSHREESITLPTPLYTRTPGSPIHSNSLSRSHSQDNPAQSLEEFRNALIAQRSPSQSRNTNGLGSLNTSSVSSIASLRETSLSQRPSVDDVPEYESLHTPASPTPPLHDPPGVSSSSNEQVTTRANSHDRGRRHSAFNFTSVSNVLLDVVKDRVRSSSPRTVESVQVGDATVSGERRGASRDAEVRGRRRERTPDTRRENADHRKVSTLGRLFGMESVEKGSGDNWKEFKKGTYTYPISIPIPANSPPTLECDYGSVIWRLKACVHRPGTFSQKLSATREVTIIAAPGEDDTDEHENIVVERQWDSQMQYLISVSGKSFPIGGTMPIHITMLPLTKMKIYRISVLLEERTDYYTQMKRIARTDPIQRIYLLSLKDGEGDKDPIPILPLTSDDPEAFKHSPISSLVNPSDDLSEFASNLMGPGPWTLHHDLPLPNSCSILHFTNKNKLSNITVQHTLKVIIRAERGDDLHIDPKTGKRRLFDIVVQTPVQILSCRCNTEWTSLPRYTETLLDDSQEAPVVCPCGVKLRVRSKSRAPDTQRSFQLGHITSRQSTDSGSTTETTAINPTAMPSLRRTDSLYNRNTQFERLVSGQESEMGEVPPPYDPIARSTVVQ